MSATSVPGSSCDSTWMLLNDAVRSFIRHGVRLAARDQEVAVDAERVLGPGVRRSLRSFHHLGQTDVDRTAAELRELVDAECRDVERHIDLVEQALEARKAVTLGAGDDAQDIRRDLAVSQIGLVATKIEVETARTRDRAGDAVLLGEGRRKGADAFRTSTEDLVATHERIDVGPHTSSYDVDRIGRALQPTCRQIFLQAADAVEHVVHPPAGDLLHHGLEHFALTKRIEDWRDRTELDRIAAQEHQVVEHAIELCEQRAGPHRTDRHFHAEHALDSEDDAELVAESRQPVMPVCQDDDLPIVACFEELLRAAMHVADDRIGANDPFTVERQRESQHAMRRRMLRPDVQHVRVGRWPSRPDPCRASSDRSGCARPDDPLDVPRASAARLHDRRVCSLSRACHRPRSSSVGVCPTPRSVTPSRSTPPGSPAGGLAAVGDPAPPADGGRGPARRSPC